MIPYVSRAFDHELDIGTRRVAQIFQGHGRPDANRGCRVVGIDRGRDEPASVFNEIGDRPSLGVGQTNHRHPVSNRLHQRIVSAHTDQNIDLAEPDEFGSYGF